MAIKEKRLTHNHYDGDTQPPPLYRRRSLQVGGSIAALAAAGLYVTLKPSHHGAGSIRHPQPSPSAESAGPTPSTAPAAQPTESSAGKQAQSLKSLCTTVPREVFAPVLSNASCSPSNRDNQSILPFRATDLADAEWGGPESHADEVVIQIRPSFEYGYDQFKIQKQVNSTSHPEDITVQGYPGIYMPEQDFTTDSGYQVRTEIAIVKAGPYLVTLAAEQIPANESALQQQEVTNLIRAVISHALPAGS